MLPAVPPGTFVSGVASRLGERVTIEQRQHVADGLGGQQVSWVAMTTSFAEVVAMPASVRERSIADQVKAVAGYRVRMRVRDDVDASMRLQWKGRTLHIHSLHVQEEMMELLTYEEQL